MNKKSKNKVDVFIVCGHNGEGFETYNPTILGLYPNIEAAQRRIDLLKDEDAPFEVLWYSHVETGINGVDCEILIR